MGEKRLASFREKRVTMSRASGWGSPVLRRGFSGNKVMRIFREELKNIGIPLILSTSEGRHSGTLAGSGEVAEVRLD